MSPKMITFLIVVAIALGILSKSVFIVDERELAIKFQLGEFVQADYEPGLYFQIPFVNNVRKFNGRILTMDAEPARYLTLEKKNIIVDAFLKWRIADVSSYYKSMAGDERQARMRLSQIINDALRSEFNKRTVQEAISGERSQIMDIITKNVGKQTKEFGIEIVDVRIKRIEWPDTVLPSVYDRMASERKQVAKDLRSRGEEAAERIQADADRQRTIILAEAYRDSERLRGEGDGKSSDIYAKAFSKNPEFYAMYRSLDAYKKVFNKQEDVLVLDPSSEFFRYFNEASGKASR